VARSVPSAIGGNQIDAKEPKRFLLIEQECGVPAREAGADRWSIDHLFIDQDAIPTIVEVKRSSDTRIRREVVGQMLDYEQMKNICKATSDSYVNAELSRRLDELEGKYDGHFKVVFDAIRLLMNPGLKRKEIGFRSKVK
jgi:hypothetical protein